MDAAIVVRELPSPSSPGDEVPAPRRRADDFTVCLQPLGTHDPSLLEPVRRGIAQAYGFSTRQLTERPMPAAAWYPPRQRHRALGLLDHLRDEVLPLEPGCDAVVGVTALDVSTPLREHPDWGVMGLAYLGGKVAVVSSFRLRRDVERRRVVERAVKVVIHELGHVVGVPHRDDGPGCIMNDAAGSVRGIDLAAGALCDPERAVAEDALGIELSGRDALDWDAIHAP